MKLDFGQFRLLLWKSWIIRKRHYIVTAFEVLVPLSLCILLAWMRTIMPSKTDMPGRTQTTDEVPAQQAPPFNPLDAGYLQNKVYYLPETDYAIKLMAEAAEVARPYMKFTPVLLKSELDLDALIINSSYYSIEAVVFEDLKPDMTKPPLKLKYTIRIKNSFPNTLYPTYRNLGPLSYDWNYKSSGFLALQAAVEKAHINLVSKANTNSTITEKQVFLQRFPYPSYVRRGDVFTFFQLAPMMIIIGLVVVSPVIVRRIVDEKNNRAKEMMRLMGMSDWLYWLTTFLNNFIVMFLISSIITILFVAHFSKDAAVLDYSSGSLFLFIMLVYSGAFISFTIAFTAFFNKPVLAMIMNIIVFTGVIYQLPVGLMSPIGVDPTQAKGEGPSTSAKLATCLLPNMGLHWICQVIAMYEGSGVGAKWSNLFEPPSVNDNLSIGLIVLVMLASCLLYWIILWYVDAVWPWQEGVPKSFGFPFHKSYWCGYTEEHSPIPLVKTTASKYFEEDPTDLTPGITLINLTKVFGRGSSAKTAVNDVSFKIYNGQITALLGHNGAGKTTTMSMITGMFTPSSGTAKIEGYDILTQTKEARRSIGLCPQHNVIYDELTVGEHLKFFAGLKGCPWNTLDQHVTNTLQILQLENKRNDLSKNLSGGMKRKLCLGIAYIGNSKILILDEPTSGMDPQARRAVWDLLQTIRQDRTILLTTHYMEEADVLGDRIAIMAEGTVKCCGSPLFLKRKFGAGYQLRIAKSENCAVNKVTNLIHQHLPAATLESDINTELLYALASGSSEHFPDLFESLEKNKDKLGIAACGVSVTTMEDVFLKVGDMVEAELKFTDVNDDYGSTETLNDTLLTERKPVPAIRLTGQQLYLQQIKGLFLKRANYAKRHWSILIFQLIIPILMWVLLLMLDKFTRDSSNSSGKAWHLDLKLFGKTNGFYSDNSTNPDVKTLASKYYVPLLASKTSKTDATNNATQFILDIADKDMNAYRTKYITGGTFIDPNPYALHKGEGLYAWYNGEAYHTAAIALSMMDTAILQMVSGSRDAGFDVTNHPLPRTSDFSISKWDEIPFNFLYACLIPFVLTFLSSSYILFPVHERVSKAKLLQLMSGLSSFLFWGVSFLWDFTIHFLICCISMIFILILDVNGVFSSSSILMGSVFVLLLLYGWCSIPLCYIVSLIFKKPTTAFCFICLFNIVTGLILSMAMAGVGPLLLQTGKKATYDVVSYFMRILPTFSVTWGITRTQAIGGIIVKCKKIAPNLLDELCNNPMMRDNIKPCCKDICEDKCADKQNPFQFNENGCGPDLLMMAVMGIVFYLILYLAETNFVKLWYWLKRLIRNRIRNSTPTMTMTLTPASGEDMDVVTERQRIEDLFVRGKTSEEAMAVINLTKSFRALVAVDRLTFGVHKEECFGLLGINGAGKTTTFRMLTGDLMLSDGNAYIGPYDLQENLKQFQTFVGYCPQFDPLLDRLTGREMLYLFGRIRGIKETCLHDAVNHLVKMVDLTKHADKMTEKYSGGNRRKLSLAMALIGSPPLVFLDEPTSGVDPAARRKIWSTLIEAQNIFHMSIILTSHSMEECEALCSRIAIMVNGQFRCLGGIQHLRSKFGQGYTVIAKLKREESSNEEKMTQVQAFIQAAFPSASLKDIHQGMIHYHVMDTSIPWSMLFRVMEDAKQQFELEDYVVSDTTLEQIFLMFARSQRIVAEPRS